MLENNKQRVLAVLAWTASAFLPFLLDRWYWDVFVQVADNTFSGVKPIGVALTLVLVAMLSLAVGGALVYWWHRTSIETFPRKYSFEKRGAILTRNGKDFCSKCFFQNRREIPLKENEKNPEGQIVLECILNPDHQYRRWNEVIPPLQLTDSGNVSR